MNPLCTGVEGQEKVFFSVATTNRFVCSDCTVTYNVEHTVKPRGCMRLAKGTFVAPSDGHYFFQSHATSEPWKVAKVQVSHTLSLKKIQCLNISFRLLLRNLWLGIRYSNSTNCTSHPWMRGEGPRSLAECSTVWKGACFTILISTYQVSSAWLESESAQRRKS